MATDVGELRVLLGADTTQFTRAMSRAQQSVDRSVTAITSKLDALSGTLTSIGVGAAAAFAGLAIPIKKMVDAASDAEENLNLLTVTFGDNTDEVLAWSKATSQAVGRSDSQMREFAGTLGALLVPMTGSVDAATEMSTNIAQLAVDMGSFFNAADTDVLDALRSGLTGEAEPLKRFGILMNQAALEAFALEKNLGKSVKEMTDAEKTTLRYNFILENTKLAQGDAARTLGGFANQMKAARAQVVDFAEAQGRLFLPVAQRVVATLRDMLAEVNNLPANTQRMIAALTVAGTAGTGLVGVFGLIASRVVGAVSGLVSLGGAATRAALGLAPLVVSMAAIAAGFVGIVAGIGAMKAAWEADLGGMQKAWDEFTDDLDFDALKKAATKTFDDLAESAIGAFTLARKAFQKVKAIFTDGKGITGEGFFEQIGNEAAAEAGAIIQEMRAARANGEGGLFNPDAAVDAAVGAGKAAGDAFMQSLEKGIDTIRQFIPVGEIRGLIAELKASGKEQLMNLADLFGIPQAGPATIASAPAAGQAGGVSSTATTVQSATMASRALSTLGDAATQSSTFIRAMANSGGDARQALANLGSEALMQSKAFQRLMVSFDSLTGAVADVIDVFGPLTDLIGGIVSGVGGIVSRAAGFLERGLQSAVDFFRPAKQRAEAARELEKLARAAERAANRLPEFGDAMRGLVRSLVPGGASVNAGPLQGRGIINAQGELGAMRQLLDTVDIANERQRGEIRSALEGLREELEDQLLVATRAGATDRVAQLEEGIARISTALNDGALALEDTVEDMNAALTNVPRGFKIALARFNAISNMEPTAPLGDQLPPTAGAPSQQFGPGDVRSIAIDTINITPTTTADLTELVESIQQADEFGATAEFGAGQGGGSGSGMAGAIAAIPGLSGQLNTGVP